MRSKENDFSTGRGQQINDSFYHFGSKRKSSLREVLSLKGVFPARNWQKEITFLTYYPFYIYVQPNRNTFTKDDLFPKFYNQSVFETFPNQFLFLRLFSGTKLSILRPSKDGHKYRVSFLTGAPLKITSFFR